MVSVVSPSYSNSDCNFCNDQILNRQKVYEDDHVYILLDHKPIVDGHCLVLPKRHVERFEDLNSQEFLGLQTAISNLYKATEKTQQAAAYNLMQCNGSAAGQGVPHTVVHFCPRKEDMSDIGMLARVYFTKFFSPMPTEEMNEKRAQLMDALQSLVSPELAQKVG